MVMVVLVRLEILGYDMSIERNISHVQRLAASTKTVRRCTKLSVNL